MLRPDHFQQLDFNHTCDLTHFNGRGINVIHVGGVLEYLERPQALLDACHQVVGPAGRMLVSIINFECQRYRQPESYHPGWIYKPTLDEFRRLLAARGWQIERGWPMLGKGRLRGSLLAALGRILKLDHPAVRRKARQFVFQVRAVKADGCLAEKGLETQSKL